jgi:hypothetical protein
MIKNAVYNILINDSTITDYVGTKVFPVLAPQDTDYPFITIIKNNTLPTDIKSAVSPTDEVFFQVDIYAAKEIKCQGIAAQVRTLLDQYSGTIASVQIDRIVFRDEQDSDFDIDLDIFGKSQEYKARIIR